MKRRDALLGFLALGAVPFGTFAQQPGRVWRIGYLSSRSKPASLDADIYGAFKGALRELGWVEGKNLVIEWRFSDGLDGPLPGFVAELLAFKVDAIVVWGGNATRAAQRATTTTPIIMATVGDPVGLGFVDSLAKPGKNITGVSNLASDAAIKHLELIRGVIPKLSKIGVLLNPTTPIAPIIMKQIKAAAAPTGIAVSVFEASTVSQIELAFDAIARARPGALIVAIDAYFPSQSRQITALAAKHRIPTIYSSNSYTEDGGLMSYAENRLVTARRAASYVDRILRGAKPADLPIEQATQLELIVNLKTAKALGLTLPQSILVRADRVIE